MKARAKKTKARKPRRAPEPIENETPAVVDALYLGRLLDRLDTSVYDALQGYGMICGGIPLVGIPKLPDTLARLAIKIHDLRHAVQLGVERAEQKGVTL